MYKSHVGYPSPYADRAYFRKDDQTIPTLLSATVPANGGSLILVFSELMTNNFSNPVDLTFDGGLVISPPYVSGNGTTTFVFGLLAVLQTSTITAALGATFKDLAGNLLAPLTAFPVTNNSTQV